MFLHPTRIDRVKQASGTMFFGRTTAATLGLAFSIGVAGGVVTTGGLAPDLPPMLTADLMPAAGLPGIDFGGRDVSSAAPPPSVILETRARLESDSVELRYGPMLDVAPQPVTGVPRPFGAPPPAARLGTAESLARAAHHVAAAGAEKAVLEVPAPATTTVAVRRGDTLMNLLLRAGVERREAHEAVIALEEVYDPRRLRAGQALEISAFGDSADRRLVGLSFDISFDEEVRVERAPDGAFASVMVERPQHRRLVHREGRIDDSLYLTAERAAVPQDLIIELIKLFSWDVDYQRDLRRGDHVELLFEELTLQDQEGVRHGGDLLYARLTLGGDDLEAYRFEHPDGGIEYYDRTGRSLRKFLLRTPVDGARLSSRFGMRRHPILGYSRMHKGTDFAAPTGTPIYAAGSGRVETAGRNGGYGNYVRIRHNGEYSTAYAHLSRFARGLRPGVRVTQGQVIGYVGSTGRSTGPHLHYEVLRAGVQINPMSLKHPPAARLAGADLELFDVERARIDRLRIDVRSATQVASKTGEATSAIR